MGQSIVIVDKLDIATELFEKRSATYSSRLSMPIVKLCVRRILCVWTCVNIWHSIGWDWTFAFMPNTQVWRRQRKMLWQHFNAGAVASLQPAQHEGARRLVVRLLDSPHKLQEHVR